MLSVFRITRAEFAKVFKKPTVYIMAIILAIVLVISLVSYSPTVRTNRVVSIDADSGSKVYSVFMGDSTTSDTKKKLDEEYIDLTNNKIIFYRNLFNRNNSLNKDYTELVNNFKVLESEFNNNNSSVNLPSLLTASKDSFTKTLNNYADMTAFLSYENLSNIINYTNSNLNESKFYEVKYFDIDQNNKYFNYITLKNTYLPQLLNETNVSSYINMVNKNNYLGLFENIVNYGNDIIYNTLNDLLTDIENTQSTFVNLVSGSSKNEANKAKMLETLETLNTNIKDFKTLVDGLTSNDAIYVVHTSTAYEVFTNHYNEFVTIYSKVDKSVLEYTSKVECVKALLNSSYLNGFHNYLDSIQFIDIDLDYVENLESYKTLAESNQTAILDKIKEYKAETSTSNILHEITNYMMLGETYTNAINNEVLKQFSTSLSLNEMKDAKNIDLSDFNEYNNKNNIAQLRYQLEKNIYSNEIGGTFSLNQTITTKENMLDFTYYALKICTMLIIIFTVMMIANLITSETDSGTIKLLLIRPYKRSTILFGKILATFFFSLSFLLFAFVVSLIAGFFMFGAPTVSQVLVTFNASKTFLINPFLLILLFFLSCAGDILFYLIVALTVSVLFRSYIGAISTSLIIYVGSLVVGSLLSNAAVYAYLPFTNISWFRFFGGEIMPSKFGLSTILASPVHSFQNIWLSIGISVGFSIILSIITFITFKRRDF